MIYVAEKNIVKSEITVKELPMLAAESLDVLLEHKTLEKGAMLYRKINSEINWTYKRDKNKV